MSCESERIDNIFDYFSQQESLGKSISLGSYAKFDVFIAKQDTASENFRLCALRAALQRCVLIPRDCLLVSKYNIH